MSAKHLTEMTNGSIATYRDIVPRRPTQDGQGRDLRKPEELARQFADLAWRKVEEALHKELVRPHLIAARI